MTTLHTLFNAINKLIKNNEYKVLIFYDYILNSSKSFVHLDASKRYWSFIYQNIQLVFCAGELLLNHVIVLLSVSFW